MDKHVCIRIYENGNVKVTNEKDENQLPEQNKINIDDISAKAQGFAFWYKVNPTCVVYNNKQY